MVLGCAQAATAKQTDAPASFMPGVVDHREGLMSVLDRRIFCLGLGASAATLKLSAAASWAHPGEAPSANNGAGPALLERPASGLGSPRLVTVEIRQDAKVYKRTS